MINYTVLYLMQNDTIINGDKYYSYKKLNIQIYVYILHVDNFLVEWFTRLAKCSRVYSTVELA